MNLRVLPAFTLLLADVFAMYDPVCIDSIQEHNLRTLSNSLTQGYTSFCSCDIDEGVLSLYPGGDPSDVTVELCGYGGNRTYQLKDICNMCGSDFDYKKKTLIFVNGFVCDTNNVKNRVRDINKCSSDYNVIIIDFAINLNMLYNTAKHNISVLAYAVLKVIDVLLINKVLRYSIILSGHSQGAQIAALAAKLFRDEREGKLPLLVAVDPAVPCDPENQHVSPDAAEQVLVIHGNNGDFSLKEPVGTVDYYPNGDEKLQPGCKSQLCSHTLPAWIFVESVCNPSDFVGVRCNDWRSFMKNACYKHDVIPICLELPVGAKGKYYSITRSQSPFGMSFKGIYPDKLFW